MKDFAVPLGGNAWIWLLPMPTYHADNPAVEMLSVKVKRFLAVATVIQVDIEFHEVTPCGATAQI